MLGEAQPDPPSGQTSTSVETTESGVNNITVRLKNRLEWGEKCLKIYRNENSTVFSRWPNEVGFRQIGVSQSSTYRWMEQFRVLSDAIPLDVARAALVECVDARRLFSGVRLNAAVVDALKKYPPPTAGDNDACSEWAMKVAHTVRK